MRTNKWIYRFLLTFFVFTMQFSTAMVHAETFSDIAKYDLTSDGTVAIIPLNINMVNPAKEFVQQLQTSNVIRISSMVYAPPGLTPYMVLSGNPSDLQQALGLLQKLLSNQTPTHLIVIAASLRELKQSKSHDIGLNPIPTINGRATVDWSRNIDTPSTRADTKHLEVSASNILALKKVSITVKYWYPAKYILPMASKRKSPM